MKSENYNDLVTKVSPKSPIIKDTCFAFLIGGTICTIGQVLYKIYYEAVKLSVTDAKTYVSITLIFLSALLTGIGIYDKIAKIGGAGTLVPITGFANSIVSAALEFQTEGRILGTAAQMFTLAGPVIVFGCSSAAVYGLIIYFFGLY